jgi:methionyl-tRNA formyltransferase
MSMKIIFMGTPDFAVPSLDILVRNNYDIVGVITAPDKPAGRGQQLQHSPVKKYAMEKGLRILQPTNLKEEAFLDELSKLNADLQIVVAFRMLPEKVWAMPPMGTFNLHGSLLPQYRGAAPINRAIMNGEKETGVTTFFLQHDIDTGKIIFREKIPIGENETAGELHDRMMIKGAALVLKTVQAIEQKKYPQEEQEKFITSLSELKHAPKIFKEDCKIDWTKSLEEIHNHIRGLSPYPGAFTELISPKEERTILKIFITEKEIAEHSYSAGQIITDSKNTLKIAVSKGFLNIHELQLAGKKRMKTSDLLRGFPLNNEWSVS